ncbi:MAG: terpene cyclase/mutase family protein [Planctomycetes bacterium]|nr:terpene cyclase/mutase family protein [Planctomycetota bacterium]
MLASASVGDAQDTAQPTIAPMSDLSSALPANEWSRVEASVDAGLRWLASQQGPDGRFPSEPVAQPAITSFAVMAFLSRGHVPDHGRYGKQISKAIDFVLATQKRRGYFCLLPLTPGGGNPNTGQTVHYNHAIAGLMLGEVYGMTTGARSRKIEEALATALLYAREVQTRTKVHPSLHGGFRYGYPDSPTASSDMSVTGWSLMFLRSARNAEFQVSKDYFDEGLDFVERCFVTDPDRREKGVFSYVPTNSPGGERPNVTLANTASAMLTLILGGRHDTDMIRAGTAWFESRDYPRPWQNGFFYLASYYSSQAIAQVGGDTWKQIYPQIARNMIEEQSDDGSWPLGTGHERNYGATYTTSLAILALTPAYQLLPIYQR